jgi:hypothetical protein
VTIGAPQQGKAGIVQSPGQRHFALPSHDATSKDFEKGPSGWGDNVQSMEVRRRCAWPNATLRNVWPIVSDDYMKNAPTAFLNLYTVSSNTFIRNTSRTAADCHLLVNGSTARSILILGL